METNQPQTEATTEGQTGANTEGAAASSAASDSLAAATSISVLENYLQNFSKELSTEQQAEGAITAAQQGAGDATTGTEAASTFESDSAAGGDAAAAAAAAAAEQEEVTQTLQLLANASAEISPPAIEQHVQEEGNQDEGSVQEQVAMAGEGAVEQESQIVMVGDMHPPSQEVLMVAMQQDPNAPSEQIAVSEVPAGMVGQTIYQATDTAVTQADGQNTQVITIIQSGEGTDEQTVVTINANADGTVDPSQVQQAVEQAGHAVPEGTYAELATVKPEIEDEDEGREKRVPLKKRSVNSNGKEILDTVNVTEIQQSAEPDKEGENQDKIIIITQVGEQNGSEAGGSQEKSSQGPSVYDFYEGDDDDAPVTTPSKDDKTGDKRKKRQYQIPKFDDGRLIDHVFNRVKKVPPSPREPKTHECDICGRTFRTSTLLRNHHNTHTGTKPYKCELCERAFGTSGELARHTKYIHTHEKPHKCPLCDYISVESSKIKRHMRSHTGEKPFKCQLCAYASTDNYKLKRHMRVHTGEKPFKCPDCDMAFSQKSSLKEHMWKHSGRRPTHKCEFCDVTFGRIADMKAHIRKMHTPGDPLICKVCENGFSDRFSYMQHIKTHRGEKIYKCGQCGYSCPQKRHLLTHMRVHTGERPYACKDCGESFKHKPTLIHHEKTKHNPEIEGEENEEGSFQCDKCDKTFSRTSSLKNHQKKHETILIATPDGAEKRKAEESPETASPRKMTRSQAKLVQQIHEGQVIHHLDPSTVSGIEGAVVDVQGIQGTVIGVDAEGGGLVIRVDSGAVGVVSTPGEEGEEGGEKEEMQLEGEGEGTIIHHVQEGQQVITQVVQQSTDEAEAAAAAAAETPHPVAVSAAGEEVEAGGGAEEETEEGEGGTIYLFVEEQ